MIDPSGPDIPDIQCYQVDGCCGPSPCYVTEDDFICQIRSLLPEGDVYNNVQPSSLPPSQNRGAATVGCATVGCEQLILGSCCEQTTIPCAVDPIAPQLAMVDSFGAVAYTAVQSLCTLLQELDPCSAQITLRCWAERFNITYDETCTDDFWSNPTLAFLVCLLTQLRYHVLNWDFLTQLAARFGAELVLRYAGDFNCNPAGWWTMARMPVDCPERLSCPPDPTVNDPQELIRLVPTCWTPPPSLNIIISPTNITIPANCNLPGGSVATLPHDDELYRAFKWLLPQLLPRSALWCVYEADLPNCIQ